MLALVGGDCQVMNGEVRRIAELRRQCCVERGPASGDIRLAAFTPTIRSTDGRLRTSGVGEFTRLDSPEGAASVGTVEDCHLPAFRLALFDFPERADPEFEGFAK